MTIGVEFGTDMQFFEQTTYSFIRSNNIYGNSYGASSYQTIATSLKNWNTGIKVGLITKNPRFELFSGIRYTNIKSKMYDNSSMGYFFIILKQEEQTTEYVRVIDINQSSNYLGVPIEASFFISKPHLFTPFIKLGVSVNYRISLVEEVNFYNDAMNNYKSDVLAKFNETDDFYSTGYFSLGIRIGQENKPNVRFEFKAPTFYFSKNTSSFVEASNYGIGFQFNFQMPI